MAWGWPLLTATGEHVFRRVVICGFFGSISVAGLDATGAALALGGLGAEFLVLCFLISRETVVNCVADFFAKLANPSLLVLPRCWRLGMVRLV